MKLLFLLFGLAFLEFPVVGQVAKLDDEILFPIQQDGKTGFINAKGEIVIPAQFSGSSYGIGFSEGLAPVHINGQWCYINKKGEVVLRTKWD